MMSKLLPVWVLVSLLAFSVLMIPSVDADILSPKKQSKIGISNQNIICDSGFFKVIRENTETVACVKPKHVEKLTSQGWAKQVDKKLLQQYLNLETIGTVKKLSVIPIKADVGKLKTETPVTSYDFVFEICASAEAIYNPNILVRSDSDSKKVELAEKISPNQCTLSVTRIKAANMDTIQATLLNKGEISSVVAELENKISSLKAELSETRKSLVNPPEEGKEKPGTKIADLRKQINDARAELHRLYFIMYTTSSKASPIEKMSFSGNPIEGETATKLAVTKSLAQTPEGQNQFDVTFEACAGNKQVRLPTIMISSDKSNITVKLGDKIAPNTCQMSFAKIVADNPESITVKATGNAKINEVSELEEKITSIQNQLIAEKQILKDLINSSQRDETFNEKVSKATSNIISLREQLLSAKAEFSKIMLETYR